MAAPLVLGIGFSGYIAGRRYDLPLPSIPEIPLPLPGLSLQLKYDNTSRGLLTDPLHPKEVGGTLNLDVTKLVRGTQMSGRGWASTSFHQLRAWASPPPSPAIMKIAEERLPSGPAPCARENVGNDWLLRAVHHFGPAVFHHPSDPRDL